MRNDDIYIDCPGKRNGDNGGIVGFSDETYLYHFGKSSPLFRSFLCKLVYHTYFISLRFACSYCRQFILADYRISPFHFRIIISRVVDLDFDKNTGSGYAGFGNDIDDAYHVAFRNDIPDRKYASHTTMDIAHHSGKIVYNDRKKTDDRRGKCLSCMARNINSHVYVHNINYYKSKEI